MIRDLSREPERSMLGLLSALAEYFDQYQTSCSYFSSDVAKLVTQPLWPSRVPRSTSCSVMLKDQLGSLVIGQRKDLSMCDER